MNQVQFIVFYQTCYTPANKDDDMKDIITNSSFKTKSKILTNFDLINVAEGTLMIFFNFLDKSKLILDILNKDIKINNDSV